MTITISIHAPTWGATKRILSLIAVAKFQSTHPHGVRRCASVYIAGDCGHFNPRTHMGCDSLSWLAGLGALHFNPRTHMGCDDHKCGRSDVQRHFNPRTHMGCDGTQPYHCGQAEIFQSTHPHGVRPDAVRVVVVRAIISIHAPTWGATFLLLFRSCNEGISIHAPTWGATFLLLFRSCNEGISIHAPTWGATSRPLQGSVAWWDFNPRTHMGCDGYHHMPCFHLLVHFNPRTHMGCDSLPD